jgi:acetoacetate decarboxylase
MAQTCLINTWQFGEYRLADSTGTLAYSGHLNDKGSHKHKLLYPTYLFNGMYTIAHNIGYVVYYDLCVYTYTQLVRKAELNNTSIVQLYKIITCPLAKTVYTLAYSFPLSVCLSPIYYEGRLCACASNALWSNRGQADANASL